MSIRILPRVNPATTGSVEVTDQLCNLDLKVGVNDDEIRKLGVVHRIDEHPFAWLPMKDGTWRRFELEPDPECHTSEYPDFYQLHLGPTGVKIPDLDFEALKPEGAAFGLDVTGSEGSEPTTLWLQDWEKNDTPS